MFAHFELNDNNSSKSRSTEKNQLQTTSDKHLESDQPRHFLTLSLPLPRTVLPPASELLYKDSDRPTANGDNRPFCLVVYFYTIPLFASLAPTAPPARIPFPSKQGHRITKRTRDS